MQVDLKKFSFKERQQIGNRLRGARIMAGLNQEEFSAKYSISLSTLKNFEIARVIPRNTTLINIINAIRDEGIAIDEHWIVFGKSSSFSNIDRLSIIKNSKQFLDEIDVLKKYFIGKGATPIVTIIKNNDMYPRYSLGDLLVGVLVEKQTVLSEPDKLYLKHLPILVEHGDSFAPFFIIQNDKSNYIVNNAKTFITELKKERMAKIVWHRHNST